MKAIYFLPYVKVDSFNTIKTELSKIIEVKSFDLEDKSKLYPKNFIDDFPNLIFIPTIFDYKNTMSYHGVAFAIRWYFYLYSKQENINFKIVLLGNEHKSSFFQNCEYSNFLKCPNVEYQENSLENVTKCLENIKINILNKNEALERIKQIGIKPPTSYKSHHSIANEWSILRWAKSLKIDTNSQIELQKIDITINSSLYYKYLEILYPVTELNSFPNKVLLNSGSILFIDDEIEKGWDIIFKSICKYKKYESFGIEFKNWNKNKIIEDSLEKAKDFDVIILDLRLHDDDFEEIDPKKISGFQILEAIKDYNKGIQVIIFSATNKIWNLQALQEAGADGFIIKESPENSVDLHFTKHSIDNIYKRIDECLNKKKLKDIYSILIPLIDKIKNSTKTKGNNLIIQQEKIQLYKELLQSAEFLLYSNPNNLKYTFLQLILIIEDIVKSFYIDSSTDQNHYVELNSEQILCLEKKKNTISLKLNPIEKWNKYSEENYLITEIDDIRNFNSFNCSADKVFFNYRLNCVLYFGYKIDLNTASKYSKLYRLRSSSVAHIGNSDVKVKDVLDSLELLNILIK